jgi:hypothetical protein
MGRAAGRAWGEPRTRLSGQPVIVKSITIWPGSRDT